MRDLPPSAGRRKSVRDWWQQRLESYRSAPAFPMLALFTVAAPAVYIGGLIRRYGMSIPLWDDWGIAPIIAHAHTGELRFAELYEQQLEARVFLPKLIFILFTLGGRYDARDGMMFSVLLCCLTALGVLLLLRRAGLSHPIQMLCFVLIVAGIFSPAHGELWLLASGFPSFMPALFIIAGLVIVQTNWSTRAKFVSCGVLAVASTFTLAHGALAWGLTFPILLLQRGTTRSKTWLSLWTALALASVCAYLWGYVKPQETPDFAPPVPFVAYFNYVAAFLGGTLAYGLRWSPETIPLGAARLAGATVLALFATTVGYIVYHWRDLRLRTQALPWIALGCYSIACAVLASLGRVGLGVQQALESRYVTFSMYLTVAVLVLLPVIAADIRRRSPERTRRAMLPRATFGVFAAAYAVLYLVSFDTSVWLLKERSVRYRLGQAAVVFSHMLDTSRVIKWTNCPRPDLVREYADMLDKLGLLRPKLVREVRLDSPVLAVADGTEASGRCDRVAVDPAGVHRVDGWAALADESHPADCVFLAYETPDRRWVPVAISNARQKRPDIVNLLEDEDSLWTGWAAPVSPAAVPPGAKLSAWAYDHEGGKLHRLSGDIAWRGGAFELLFSAASSPAGHHAPPGSFSR